MPHEPTHERDLDQSLAREVRSQQNELLGVKAFELAAEAVDAQVSKETNEIRQLVAWEAADLELELQRMDEIENERDVRKIDDDRVDLLFDEISEQMLRKSVEINRRFAVRRALRVVSRELHYYENLVPA